MNYYCSHITQKHKSEWEELVAKNKMSGYHQSFAWGKFKQEDDWETYKIGIFDTKNDKLVGGCIVLQFNFTNCTNFLYIPEGPVLNYQDEDQLFWQWRILETALHSIISLKPENLTTHLRIEPRALSVPNWFLTGFSKAPINLQPRNTQVLNLTTEEEELLAQMKPKGRYNIRLAEKKGIEVSEIPLTEINTFYKLYKTTFERNKFDGKNLDFFKTYLKYCGEFSKIFVAKVDKKVLSAAIIVYFGNRATYLYGASSSEMREYMAPNGLHWHIIKDAKQQGCTEYDFWGVAKNEDDENHDWHGFTKFKKKFGGEQLDFIGAYDYVIQKDPYEEFIKKHESD